MARVPQSRISRADPEVTQLAPPSFGNAAVFQSMAQGFANIAELARPAAERQAQARGAGEAVEAVRGGTFKAREGLTVADEAFNEIGSRVFVARMADSLSVEAERVGRLKQGDPAGMAEALDGLADGMRTGLPETGTARMAFEETFGRIRSAFIQRAAKEEVAHLGDQDSAAALELFDAMGRNLQNLTMAGAGPGELAGQFSEMQEMLAWYGPREEFTVNGVTDPANQKRAGILTVAQIADRILKSTDEVKGLQLRAAYNEAEDKGAFLMDLNDKIMEGQLDISPERAGAVFNDLKADLAFRNRAASAADAQEAAALRIEGERRLTDVYMRMAGLVEGPVAPGELEELVAQGFISASQAKGVIEWLSDGGQRPDETNPESLKYISAALYRDGADPRELMGWLSSNVDKFSASDFATWMQKLDSFDPGSENAMTQEQRYFNGVLKDALTSDSLLGDADFGAEERRRQAMAEYWRRTVENGEPPAEVADDISKRSVGALQSSMMQDTGALVRPRGAVMLPDGSLNVDATMATIGRLIAEGKITGNEIVIQRDLILEWQRRQQAAGK